MKHKQNFLLAFIIAVCLAATGPVIRRLNDLYDVTLATAPSNGQALVYQNGIWTNGAATASSTNSTIYENGSLVSAPNIKDSTGLVFDTFQGTNIQGQIASGALATNLIVTSGFQARGSGPTAIAVSGSGTLATAVGDASVSIGDTTVADGPGSISVGAGAKAYAQGGNAIGQAAVNSGKFSPLFGQSGTIGTNAFAGVGLGFSVLVSNTNAVALGPYSSATFDNSTALGASSKTSKTNQIVLGGTNSINYPTFPVITLPGITASSILRVDGNKDIAIVTIGSGLSFDGTTLSSVAGGGNVSYTDFNTNQFNTNSAGWPISIKAAATITNGVFSQPTIADFTSSTHNHQNSAGGGTLSGAAITTGLITRARGGLNTDSTTYGNGLFGSDGSNNTIDVDNLTEFSTALGVTGSPSASTYLCGNGTWATPAGSGGNSYFNGSNITDPNWTNMTASATVPGITYTSSLATNIQLTVGLATGSVAGALSANAQDIGGLKSFVSGVNITNAEIFFSGPISKVYENVSGTDVDWATGNTFSKTLSGNTTLTFSNLADNRTIELRIVQDATGGRTLTAPTHIPENSTNQTSATATEVNTNANAITTFFFKRIGGTTYMEGPSTAGNKGLTDFALQNMSSAQFFSHVNNETGSGLIVGNINPTMQNGTTSGGGINFAEDSDNGSNVILVKATDNVTSDKTITLPDATGTVVLNDNTATLTGKTYDAAGTGNVLKFLDYKDFVYPGKVDGTGCTIVTNDITSNLYGLANYNGSDETNANYAYFRIGTVPLDVDTAQTMTLKNLAIRTAGSTTTAFDFDIGLFSPASSTGHAPTAWSSFSSYIRGNSGTLTTAAAEDIFYFGDITLTGWASAVTAGRPFIIGIARVNNANNDVISIVGGTIEYGRTK